MTTRGRLFLGAGACVTVAGLVLGLPDLTKIGVLLLLLPALAAMLARRDLDLEVSRTVAPLRVTADAHADVTVRVHNSSRLRTPLLRGEEGLAFALGDRPHLLIPKLDHDESRRVTYRVRSHVRGRHRIGPLTIRVNDPFGLATRAVALPGETVLVVLPRVLPLGPVRGVPASGGGDTSTSPRVALQGEEDVGVREYRVGDDLRRVHWRSTARTGQMMVRQDEQPTRRRALVLLDDRASAHAGTGDGGSFEWSVTAVASVVTLLLGEGFQVHLCRASDEAGGVVPVEGLDHALDDLAGVQPSGTTSPRGLSEALDEFTQHGGGMVVGVLGALDDEVAALFTASNRRGIAMVIDHGGFTDRGSAPGPADATVQRLTSGGWRAEVVRPGADLAQIWARTTVGVGVLR
ncbi:DUF58 domain-containing protein [Janibacter limosus]|uniref:DUF58 domain-containing protein n=1 Tax=Janibacter limosus TaxID=53458 RepID=A0A4P6MXX7_9MICO|nr:DUF58 domain-containing protein [Janibacter limosus]QBF46353.1 DUF58 domain-containing protein [Janibacter limosus]